MQGPKWSHSPHPSIQTPHFHMLLKIMKRGGSTPKASVLWNTLIPESAIPFYQNFFSCSDLLLFVLYYSKGAQHTCLWLVAEVQLWSNPAVLEMILLDRRSQPSELSTKRNMGPTEKNSWLLYFVIRSACFIWLSNL